MSTLTQFLTKVNYYSFRSKFNQKTFNDSLPAGLYKIENSLIQRHLIGKTNRSMCIIKSSENKVHKMQIDGAQKRNFNLIFKT